MAVGTLNSSPIRARGSAVQTWSNESATNTTMTVSTGPGAVLRVVGVSVVYSGAASVTATVTLNSALGAAFDVLLQNIVFGAETDGFWTPDQEILLDPGDALDVVAPQVAAVTSTITIITEAV